MGTFFSHRFTQMKTVNILSGFIRDNQWLGTIIFHPFYP